MFLNSYCFELILGMTFFLLKNFMIENFLKFFIESIGILEKQIGNVRMSWGRTSKYLLRFICERNMFICMIIDQAMVTLHSHLF